MKELTFCGWAFSSLLREEKLSLSLEKESSAFCPHFTKTLYNRVLVYETDNFYIEDLEEN